MSERRFEVTENLENNKTRLTINDERITLKIASQDQPFANDYTKLAKAIAAEMPMGTPVHRGSMNLARADVSMKPKNPGKNPTLRFDIVTGKAIRCVICGGVVNREYVCRECPKGEDSSNE